MKKMKKSTWIISLAVLLLIAGMIVVFAALRDTTATVTEGLTPADVTYEVNEDYSVKNTSDNPVLIRVRVIVNKTEGDEIIPGDTPEYTVGSDWTQIGDYLCYNGIVAPKDSDTDTTAAAITISPEEDTQLVVLAEAIQAASTAASEEWGVSYSNGSWS